MKLIFSMTDIFKLLRSNQQSDLGYAPPESADLRYDKENNEFVFEWGDDDVPEEIKYKRYAIFFSSDDHRYPDSSFHSKEAAEKAAVDLGYFINEEGSVPGGVSVYIKEVDE